MKKYRKLPVVIEAVQWDGTTNLEEVEQFVGKKLKVQQHPMPAHEAHHPAPCSVFIETLEGEMEAKPSDFIIKGVNGEFYPCKPDIFNKTYEEVPD